MFSGKNILMVGLLAGAGLVTVHEGHRQVTLGYEIGKLELGLHRTGERIEDTRARIYSMQAPTVIKRRVEHLRIPVKPASELALYTPSELEARPEVRNSTRQPRTQRNGLLPPP